MASSLLVTLVLFATFDCVFSGSPNYGFLESVGSSPLPQPIQVQSTSAPFPLQNYDHLATPSVQERLLQLERRAMVTEEGSPADLMQMENNVKSQAQEVATLLNAISRVDAVLERVSTQLDLVEQAVVKVLPSERALEAEAREVDVKLKVELANQDGLRSELSSLQSQVTELTRLSRGVAKALDTELDAVRERLDESMHVAKLANTTRTQAAENLEQTQDVFTTLVRGVRDLKSKSTSTLEQIRQMRSELG